MSFFGDLTDRLKELAGVPAAVLGVLYGIGLIVTTDPAVGPATAIETRTGSEP